MPDIPVSEVRRVVIQYEIQVPQGGTAAVQPATPSVRDIAEEVRRELIRMGSRNPDIFGGRA